MGKHFVITPEKQDFNRAELANSKIEEILIHKQAKSARDRANESAMSKKDNLRFVHGRVIVKLDIEAKNSHRFEDGTVIRRERKFNEFNMRVSQPVNALVISAEYIPEGVEVLISHNSVHDTNKIFDYEGISGSENETDIRYYSIPEDDCFAWRDVDGKMKPLKGYQFGLRVYKPYVGSLTGIEPELIKDTLYVTTGELAGSVVATLKACDYQIVYQDSETGREANIIRFRHSDDEEIEREEVLYVDNGLTELLKSGGLLVGLTPQDAVRI